jgi:hypothetical protein
MLDMEKVIKELECCVSLSHNGSKCANCDYADEFHNGDCETYLLRDALALLKAQEQKCRKCGEATSKAIQELQAKLKAQEPRVMTAEEYDAWTDIPFTERDPVFHEERTKRGSITRWVNTGVCSLREYGKNDRCWTSRPDRATMEAVKWNGCLP